VSDDMPTPNPQAIAETGERIYEMKLRSEYEAIYRGWFLAIEINTEETILAKTSEEAIQEARNRIPHGIFHIRQIG